LTITPIGRRYTAYLKREHGAKEERSLLVEGYRQALPLLNPKLDFSKPLPAGTRLELPSHDEIKHLAAGKKPYRVAEQ
jgi:hypothetical protein